MATKFFAVMLSILLRCPSALLSNGCRHRTTQPGLPGPCARCRRVNLGEQIPQQHFPTLAAMVYTISCARFGDTCNNTVDDALLAFLVREIIVRATLTCG